MTDLIFSVMDRLGPVGVAVLIALENIVPPVPSELILPLAGFRARSGAMNPVAVWVAATIGSLAGALALYGVGAWLGYERLHRLAGRRWFVLTSQADLERGQRLFVRHGSWMVAGARCLPLLRSLVSLPAGVTRMPLGRFSLLTVAGAGTWNLIFVWAGWVLAENWHRVEDYLAPVGPALTVAVVVGLGVLAWRKVRRSRAADYS